MDLKTFAIETFEIAEWNVLKAIFRLKPKDLEKQISPNLNLIRWIIGHLTMHLDTIFNYLCPSRRELRPDFIEYFTSGIEKEYKRNFPVFYKDLIETFLEFSESSITYSCGVKKKNRGTSRIKWLIWWNKNKDTYQ